MINFRYVRARDVPDAIRLAQLYPDAKFVAGGTNLIDLMKVDVEKPATLIDINGLPLGGIQGIPGGGLRIGAMVRNSDLAFHPLVEQRYPMLSSAIMSGASQQLRNAATTGGNLLQRTRCHYFYDATSACNKREPGAGCSAIDGHNRALAILGASTACIAVHPSDMCVALSALDATIHISGPAGDRVLPISQFHRLPGDTPQFDNVLGPAEIIVAVELPPQGFPGHYSYVKLRDRASYAFALVSVAAGLEIEGDTMKQGRIALGGVAHKPWRSPEAEASLRRQPATAETFARAADLLLKDAKAVKHNTFKIELAHRCIVRTLLQAARGTPQSQSSKAIL